MIRVLAAVSFLAAALLPGAARTAAAEGGAPPAPPSPPPAADAPPTTAAPVALDRFLKGRVVSLDEDGVVDVRYDLKDAAQLEDFVFYRPFRVRGTWEQDLRDARLRLKGTGGIVWKPVLKKHLEMTFQMRLGVARDAGAFIAEDRDSEHYTLFSIYDQFFQNKDNPGSQKVHMICRFLPPDQAFDGELVFRYVARGPKPALTVGKPFPVVVKREGIDDELRIGDDRLAGNEANWAPLRGLRPGLYVLDSDATWWDLRIRGMIDPSWAAAVGVDLKLPLTAAAAPPERTAGPADEKARAAAEAFRSGEGSHRELIRAVADRDLLESVRREAAEALRSAGTAKHVPDCVPLLESDDLLTRTLGDAVVKHLAGRGFGFVPDGPEDRRRKAVRSLVEYIEKNPARFR